MIIPSSLKKLGNNSFKITWADGHESLYSAKYLRANCRCALCQNELTGEKILKESEIPADIGITKAEIIGQYALGFVFSDNHSTGIYTFENLFKMCPCETHLKTA